MRDPVQIHGPKPKSANASRLMEARGRASLGESVNFCPYGCQADALDDKGYCYHLVGFTVMDKVVNGQHVPGKFYEPLGPPDKDGLRRTRVKKKRVNGKEVPDLPRCEPGDKYERITSNHRVYRNVPSPFAVDPDPADVDDDVVDDDPADDVDDDELERLTTPNTAGASGGPNGG